jgi:UDP-N-acetylmuramyl-tripeptide synthetase
MDAQLTPLLDRLRRDVRGRVRTDSRQVRPGDAFIAWPGAAVDGRRFVAQALADGATLALVEADGAAAFGYQDARVLPVPQLKALTGPLLAAYLGQPSDAVDVVAITGTNGKTSCAWWLSQLLSALGEPAGLMGTLGIGRPALPNQAAQIEATGLTTPDPLALQSGLRTFADQGLKVCALEASSIGIEEHRLAGCRVAVAVFTNFTQDHLDYHGSMDAYWQAKARLFQWPGLQAAVLHTDDPQGGELLHALRDRSGLALWTYGLGAAHVGANHLQAVDLHSTTRGQAFTVVETDDAGRVCDRMALEVPLVGVYNAMNVLAVLAVVRARRHSLAAAVAACGQLSPVPGRMERAADAEPLVLVDYAHTPDALDKALQALRPLALARQGRLWVVVGCGGDRDPIKRPLMAAAAERQADHCVFTSDNPRSEDPAAILAQMCAGLQRADAVRIEPDRATAIADAVRQAQSTDVVLIAGKGHEDYQEVAGVRRPFNDREHAAQALRARTTQEVSA